MCATHVPRANLLYSPRNKILATSLLIEAFLYEEQTRRGVSIRHWDEFADVADHCTVCHKCVTPCPVDIDFGDVSMAMRNLLRRMGKKRFNPGTAAAMLFLNATNPETIKLARKVMMDWGYKVQRFAYRRAATRFARAQTAPAGDHRQAAPIKEQVIHFVNKRMPGGLPKRPRARCSTSRTRLRADHPRSRDDQQRIGGGVLFPRLRVRAAVLPGGPRDPGHALARRVQTVLPPGYLCCGYPQRGAGDFDKGEKIITDNRVLFHRVANTLNYLDIKTVIVSCGTCFDQLQKYEFEEIFRGAASRHPRVSAGEGRAARGRHRRALPVPRSLPFADEDP